MTEPTGGAASGGTSDGAPSLAPAAVAALLDALDARLLLVDGERRVVHVNTHARADAAGLRRCGLRTSDDPSEVAVVGEPLEELFPCPEEPDECEREPCRGCLINDLAGHALQRGSPAQGESRPAEVGEGELDVQLRVEATPVRLDGGRFVLLALTDISGERRRRALEQIFFRDVLNTTSILRSTTTLLAADPGLAHQLWPLLLELCQRLVGELSNQRALADASAGELVARREPLSARAVLERIASTHRFYEQTSGVSTRVAEDIEDVAFSADPILLSRVLGNVVRNAIEASRWGDVIELRCAATASTLELSVHTPSVVDEHAHGQVFVPVPTPELARGLGSYGARLLTKRYLGGRVDFSSERGRGTTCIVSLPR